MSGDMMDLEQLASYLRRDQREVSKLASRGQLPGQKVSGAWRFHRTEINQWLETQMPAFTDRELSDFERVDRPGHAEPLISALMPKECVSVPLPATTRTSVLRQLVQVAEQSWLLYDPNAILEAIRSREDMASTALDSGVAIPHPHRPLPQVLGESVIAYGRTSTGIPFGGPRGMLTDIFFLVCCRDDRTHLQVLARLSRLLLRPDFVDRLRAAETPEETWQVIDSAERELSSD